jgi:hypothetical protein
MNEHRVQGPSKHDLLVQLGHVTPCSLGGQPVGSYNQQQDGQARSWICENGWVVVGEFDGDSMIRVMGPGATLTSPEVSTVTEYFRAKITPPK